MMKPAKPALAPTRAIMDSPKAIVSAWQRAMEQGNQAYARQQDQLALQQYHDALKQAQSLLRDCVQTAAQDVPIDTVFAAYVVSYHNLASVHARQGDINAAVCRLCEVHYCLSRICHDPAMGCALREAAERHGQRTYNELLNFSHLYSQHPIVTKTLRNCGRFCAQQGRPLH